MGGVLDAVELGVKSAAAIAFAEKIHPATKVISDFVIVLLFLIQHLNTIKTKKSAEALLF